MPPVTTLLVVPSWAGVVMRVAAIGGTDGRALQPPVVPAGAALGRFRIGIDEIRRR